MRVFLRAFFYTCRHLFPDACIIAGPLLLSLSDNDLANLLLVTHPLHRRKIEIGVTRLIERGEWPSEDQPKREALFCAIERVVCEFPPLPRQHFFISNL